MNPSSVSMGLALPLNTTIASELIISFGVFKVYSDSNSPHNNWAVIGVLRMLIATVLRNRTFKRNVKE